MAPKTKPLLDLDTLVERPKIRIDGALYEILAINELSVLDSQRFMRWGQEIQRLSDAGEEGGKEMQELVDGLARKVLVGVPADVYAKLSGFHKLQVALVFSGLLLGGMIGPAGAIAQTLTKSIGANSSPASSASTAASPDGGSKRRRRRS